LPVVLPGGSADDIPSWLIPAAATHYEVTDFTVAGAEFLLRALTGQASQPVPPLGIVPVLPARGVHADPGSPLPAAAGRRWPAAAQLPVLSNLPRRPVLPLVGRTAELDELRNLVRSTPGCSVLVDGSAGAGKTTLALQVCHELASAQPALFDSIIWLAGKTSLLGTEGETMATVGVSGLSDLTATMALTLDRLELVHLPVRQRAAGLSVGMSRTRNLIVLDNYETVSDTRVLTYLRSLPETCSLIITSRYRIDSPQRIHLSPLTDADAKELVRREMRQRNVAEVPGAVDSLALASGGLPLAINWLAARQAFTAPHVALTSAADDDDSLLQHLFNDSFATASDSFGAAPLLVLAHAPGTVPQAVLADSLAHLGVPPSEVSQALSALMTLNLADYDQESRRYSVLPISKRFLANVAERDPGLGGTFLTALADAYARALSGYLAGESAVLWSTGYAHNDWDRDRTSVLITLERTLADGNFQLGTNLANSFYPFAITFGHFEEFMRTTELLLSRHDQLDRADVVALRARRASVLLHSGNVNAAARELELAEPVFRDLPSVSDELANLMYFVRGIVAEALGSAEAESIFREAIEFERRRGVVWARLGFQGWLGQHLTRTGQLGEAQKLLAGTLAECQAAGDHRTSAFVQVGLARLRLVQQDYQTVIAEVSEMLPTADEFGEDINRAHLNRALAEAYQQTGRTADALRHLGVARELYRRLGADTDVSRCDAIEAELPADGPCQSR
jgi:tetratricopeptide (TPR) repeat protein